MRFWDASGVVPLLLGEAHARGLETLLHADRDVLVWWGTEVECISALRRREREGALSREAVEAARGRLSRWSGEWSEVLPTEDLRATAVRLLGSHALRSGDALQLAAATQAARGRPTTLPFVCLDQRLADAASREGFPVESPAA
jgi:predicted nucleic acid-binding protein